MLQTDLTETEGKIQCRKVHAVAPPLAKCSSMSEKAGLLLPQFLSRPAVKSSFPPRPLTSKAQEAKKNVRSCRNSALKKTVATTNFFNEKPRKVIDGGVLLF